MSRENRIRLSCPHCGSYLRIHHSEQHTLLCREAWLRCTNDDCGWAGAMILEIARTITPSLSPNPAVRLPISDQARKSLLSQLLPEAN